MRINGYLFGILAVAFGVGSARADVSMWTANGSSSDGPLSGSATFTTTNGVLSVTLTDTLLASAFKSSGQAVSDISFTVSNNVTSVGSTSASGQFADVDGSGNVTYVAQDNTSNNTFNGLTTPTRWISNGTLTGTNLALDALGNGQPSAMIAPTISNGGQYVNANNGVQQFNSYVVGSATFTLNLTGITADTTVSNVVFSFGTKPSNVDGVLSVVPEPSTMLVATFGAIGFVGYGLRRRKAS